MKEQEENNKKIWQTPEIIDLDVEQTEDQLSGVTEDFDLGFDS